MPRTLAMVTVLAMVSAGIIYATASQSADTNPSTSSDSIAALAAEMPNECKVFCETVLKRIVKGDPDGAFQAMTKPTPLPNEDWNAAALKWSRDLRDLQRQSGPVVGFELVGGSKIRETMRKFEYLLKYEHRVMRWEFVFYRPHREWKLFAFKFDANFDPLFK